MLTFGNSSSIINHNEMSEFKSALRGLVLLSILNGSGCNKPL